jgi:hypothetical protein
LAGGPEELGRDSWCDRDTRDPDFHGDNRLRYEGRRCSQQRRRCSQHEQIYEARFETSYQHYPDLWTLLAENPNLAPYVIGGDKPGERLDRGEAEKEAIQAAESLDITLYAFNRALRMPDGTLPSDVLKPDAHTPPGINDREWSDWKTWANTMIVAFEDAPGMCPLLSGDKGRRVYGSDFQDAVHDAVPNCIVG